MCAVSTEVRRMHPINPLDLALQVFVRHHMGGRWEQNIQEQQVLLTDEQFQQIICFYDKK